MRLTLILGTTATALFFAAPTQQAKADYCVIGSDDVGQVCGHATMAQCEQTRSGLGGHCVEDQFSRANNHRARPAAQPRRPRAAQQ